MIAPETIAEHRLAAEQLSDAPVDDPRAVCKLWQFKDIVVIGWIDPNRVPLPSAGIDERIKLLYPVDGQVDVYWKPDASLCLLLLSKGIAKHPFEGRTLTRAERRYILHWLFKFAANKPPPERFANQAAVDAFAKTSTEYKLFSQMRVGFFIGGRGPAAVLRYEAYIGITEEPIFGTERPGEAEADNGKLWYENGVAHLFNKGNPEKNAVQAFNTLANDISKHWQPIASKIVQSLLHIEDSDVENENYPTYWIYERVCDVRTDGPFRLKHKRVQASSPEDHLV